MSVNRICICICICVIERVPSMGICRLWQPVRRRDGRTCPACPTASIGQYAQYSRACPTASSIACSSQRQCLPDQAYRCTGILAYRHTGVLARQRNAFPLAEGQDGNAKPPKTIRMPDTARHPSLSGAVRRCSSVLVCMSSILPAALLLLCDLWETSTRCWKTLKLP